MTRREFPFFDVGLLAPALILVIFGLATLFSIDIGYFKSQLFFAVVSLVVYFVISSIDLKILELYSWPIYIISLVLLFGILILGIESRGAIRWLEILGVRIQFSEILKPLLLIPLASFLSKSNKQSFSSFVTFFLFLTPVALFIFLQPDLGSALIYILVALCTLIAVGFPFPWFAVGFLVLAVFFPILWHFLHNYQRQRLLTFIDPTRDPLGASYNAIQAIIAVGSGMLFGKGLGQGTQSGLRFLPEQHTDFIFATLSEDFGFIGALLVIVVFILLLKRIFAISNSFTDSYSRIIATASFFLLLIQFFINLGMNMGILPVVGVPLPFVSYGGSSLLSNFILLGFLSSLSKSSKSAKVLEIK